ncbi:MAG: uroporphyrinogen decarboxylase family protein [Phycisphaerae bacterium]
MIDRADARVHAPDEMTSRQRLLAAYRREPTDRLPFWAKVTNETWRRGQPEKVRNLSDLELLDYILADGIFHAPRCAEVRLPRVERTESIDGNIRTVVSRTPDGDLIERWTRDETTGSWHPTEFPVKTREDLKRYRWLHECDVRPRDGEAAEAQVRAGKIGQRGITKCGWGTSPLMHLVEHVIGPAETIYFLADYPAEMDDLMARMHEVNMALVRCVAQRTPADVIVSVENTSTTLISPHLFEKYCLRHLCDYGRIISGAGKLHELHMCGLLSALLEMIDTIPADSIEAFTAPPLADTRLVDGKTRAPSKTFVGGTCVNVWWRRSAEQIEQYILGELDACPDHRGIVLTTAGVAPPACAAETFRAVGRWLASVPVRM